MQSQMSIVIIIIIINTIIIIIPILILFSDSVSTRESRDASLCYIGAYAHGLSAARTSWGQRSDVKPSLQRC